MNIWHRIVNLLLGFLIIFLNLNGANGTASFHYLNSQDNVGETTVQLLLHQGDQGHTVHGPHHKAGTKLIYGLQLLQYLPK